MSSEDSEDFPKSVQMAAQMGVKSGGVIQVVHYQVCNPREDCMNNQVKLKSDLHYCTFYIHSKSLSTDQVL